MDPSNENYPLPTWCHYEETSASRRLSFNIEIIRLYLFRYPTTVSPFNYSCHVFNTRLVIASCRLPSSIFLLFSAQPCDLEGRSLWAASPGILFRFLLHPAHGKHGQRWWAEEDEALVGRHSFPALVATVLTRLSLYHILFSCSSKPNSEIMAFWINVSNHGDLNNSLLIICCYCCCCLLCPHLYSLF